MKKTTTLCLIACALASNNNAFGMLYQKRLIPIIKTKHFHTSAPNMAISTDNLVYENNGLLREIIKQNKENNDLLLTIIQQNRLIDCQKWDHWQNYDYQPVHDKLLHLYETLEKKYNINLKEE
ncbi:MAG TPA: hypothetical protein VKR54_02025 [Candidatus Babeliales bacterium]|jgi:hypothetical protein|nr:hypothetical protein [Candidatus Babeliales bacterium]